jgi:glucose/arabinose dehydrogenase
VRRTSPALAAAAAAAAAVVLAAAPSGAWPGSPGLDDPLPGKIEKGTQTVALRQVAGGFNSPLEGTFAPGHPHRLFVIDQIGKIWSIDLTGARTKKLFADVSGLLVPLGLFGIDYDERGLLGLAFHPHYRHNGLLYTYTSEPKAGDADFSTIPSGTPDHQNVVREWRVRDAGNPDTTVDPTTSRVLLRMDHPQFNHNGGSLAFGRDGKLYIAVGDGGNADDTGDGHVPAGNAQTLTRNNVLGKVLRIDPRGFNSRNGEYGVPADNPFVGANVAGEIWAYGFRNPYRMSVDRGTGRVYAGDAGQNDIEEIDVVGAGRNYGWRVKEGTFIFNTGGADQGYVVRNSPGSPRAMTDPVAQYDHWGPNATVEGIAVVGGFVYRGSAIPALQGRYVFGDYSREFATPQGRLFYLNRDHAVKEFRLAGRSTLGIAVQGFAQDAHGEVYVLGNTTGVVSGSTGVVLKLVPAGG